MPASPHELPRAPLAHLPTPLEPLPRLSAALGGPTLWVKRDDATGLALGGNKTRKLELLLGAALAEGATTVVTIGAVQSNHCRQTAAAAARCGLACELLLPRLVDRSGEAYDRSGNVLLDHLLGAEVHVVDDVDAALAELGRIESRVEAAGGSVRFIPLGGSDATGSAAYLAAAEEVVGQLDALGVQPASVVVPCSSMGTVAGLVAGFARMGRPVEVVGVDVYEPAERTRPVAERLVAAVCTLLGAADPGLGQLTLVDDHLGPGYGLPTPEMVEAVRLVAGTEGLVLDPVYTGKAAAALVAMVREGRWEPDEHVVLWHTGGTPALFAYPDAFAP